MGDSMPVFQARKLRLINEATCPRSDRYDVAKPGFKPRTVWLQSLGHGSWSGAWGLCHTPQQVSTSPEGLDTVPWEGSAIPEFGGRPPPQHTLPWSRKWQPTSVFLPEESHGEGSLVGYRVHRVAKSQTQPKQHTCTPRSLSCLIPCWHHNKAQWLLGTSDLIRGPSARYLLLHSPFSAPVTGNDFQFPQEVILLAPDPCW